MELQQVIGLVGMKVAGKGTISRYLQEKYGYTQLVTGEAIRAELLPILKREPLTTDLMDYANTMKLEKGAGYWMEVLLAMVRERELSHVVIDGIRHPDELSVLSAALGGKFLPIGIVAPFERRLDWFFSRQKAGDVMDRQWFVYMDARDQGLGEPPHGQQVAKTLDCLPSVFVYNNDKTVEDIHRWLDVLVLNVLSVKR